MAMHISKVGENDVAVAHVNTVRTSSLDVMKCLAAFGVVWIHYGSEWLTPIVRCSAPIFFIITGYYYPLMLNTNNFWRHFRKLFVMALWASALYAIWELLQHVLHNDLQIWYCDTFSLQHIIEYILSDQDLFGFHLWYFWAVLYDLILLYWADKLRISKWLEGITPVLFWVYCMGNFTSNPDSYRNFLFMGLPCMMVGKLVKEHKDGVFLFFAKGQYICFYTVVSFSLIVAEIFTLHAVCSDNGIRNMYIFTIPLILPFFYWALCHPSCGAGTIFETIGRKYSAYIYIFHVLAARVLSQIIARDTSLISMLYTPFLVFGLSLFMAWTFEKIKFNVYKLSINRV